MSPLAELGDGAASFLAEESNATVVGTFRHGFYLRAQRALMAVGGPGLPPGPLHLRLPTSPPRWVEGTLVRCGIDRLTACRERLDLRDLRRYRPLVPTPSELTLAGRLLASRAARLTDLPDLRAVAPAALFAVAAGDLEQAAQYLAGRGTGLTPSGDDVLAGLLLHRSWSGSACSPRWIGALATTDLSREFLLWAALGQSIEPVHHLIADAVDGDLGAWRRSEARLTSVGHSSGRALLTGLVLAARAATGNRPLDHPGYAPAPLARHVS